MLVMHYTGMQSAAAAIARLRDPASRVSSHYVVDEDGSVLRLVPEAARAWHAGVSYWQGRRQLNDVSIGVEIANPGHEWGYRAFPRPQIAALLALCQDILSRWPIPAWNVVGHSDIAPSRKQDPGELFPWDQLAAEGIGLWMAPQQAEGPLAEASDDRNALSDIGYDVEATPLADTVRAFQRHWRPGTVTGEIDPDTRGCLRNMAELSRRVRAGR